MIGLRGANSAPFCRADAQSPVRRGQAVPIAWIVAAEANQRGRPAFRFAVSRSSMRQIERSIASREPRAIDCTDIGSRRKPARQASVPRRRFLR